MRLRRAEAGSCVGGGSAGAAVLHLMSTKKMEIPCEPGLDVREPRPTRPNTRPNQPTHLLRQSPNHRTDNCAGAGVLDAFYCSRQVGLQSVRKIR
jgi:hypothetical protein